MTIREKKILIHKKIKKRTNHLAHLFPLFFCGPFINVRLGRALRRVPTPGREGLGLVHGDEKVCVLVAYVEKMMVTS